MADTDVRLMDEPTYRETEMSILGDIKDSLSNTKTEETTMDGISGSRTLADLGALGGLYGATGSYRNGIGCFASPEANAVRINRNSDLNECYNLSNIRGQDIILENQQAAQVQNRFFEVDNKIDALARQNAECCCDLKQMIQANTTAIVSTEARLTGLIKDTTIAGLERDLAECRQQACCNNTTTQVCGFIDSRFPRGNSAG